MLQHVAILYSLSRYPLYGWIYHILVILSSAVGLLVYFCLLALMNKAIINIHVQVFVWVCVFISLAGIPRGRIIVSHGNSIFLNLGASFVAQG